ncbi:hypothetical protein F441_09539 [Phytophthora nicotianae CJ01A1]|uniref:Uncharacterized protein n=5 Tax=Phytophthora nicotianae TaxID=4792 RepID=W2Q518_PHYN3|nr:hypothetical protein PPTG_23077 [Phytophthora nicotianae INRA-310]ETI45972.1 hypothetical protein F443_09607 [Phytophthora nicotianae P1569]ETO74667.1 hypothetical protein F444_09669 [Phytophthora nicotianae P1976]ETP15800.1 hypothetical protein F441_09539 [Phytophthora nicotianae CJ01A1]ETP43822.1 hypothetical protein F442_09513 [Phytophthora nicotianae P10297]ETN08237.1 hypothetical protein PPTG_23077 [Phytophthora nicotianae INRA-310]
MERTCSFFSCPPLLVEGLWLALGGPGIVQAVARLRSPSPELLLLLSLCKLLQPPLELLLLSLLLRLRAIKLRQALDFFLLLLLLRPTPFLFRRRWPSSPAVLPLGEFSLSPLCCPLVARLRVGKRAEGGVAGDSLWVSFFEQDFCAGQIPARQY